MATMVTYNGVRLFNVLTRDFRQEAVYDDSGTDLLYHRFTVSVIGMVHALSAAITGGGVYTSPMSTTAGAFSGGAAQNAAGVRHALGEPRKEFEMKLGVDPTGAGGQVLLSCNPATGKETRDVDLNNGPHPKVFNVVHVAGDAILRVEFSIEICKLECGSGQNASGILNNRWAMTDDIDQNFYTTRTIQGRLKITSAKLNPHSFRSVVVPGLEAGFKRDHMTFVATADGLNLDYTIVDRQVAFAAPIPATRWRYEHSETTGNGLNSFGQMSVEMAGPPRTDKKLLISMAAQLIISRLIGKPIINNPNKQAEFTINEQTITDIVSDNETFIRMTANVTHNTADPQVFMQILGQFFATPPSGADIIGYNNMKSINPATGNLEGAALITRAFSAHLQSPCDAGHGIEQYGIVPSPERETTNSGPSVQAFEVPAGTLPEISFYSLEHQEAIYTNYQIESRYEMESNVIQAPIAAPQGSPSQATCAFIELAAPTAKRIIRVSAERIGKEPVIPSSNGYTDENGISGVLLKSVVIPAAPEPTSDGKLKYRREVQHIYGLSRPPREDEQIRTGITPWLRAASLSQGAENPTKLAFPQESQGR